MKQIVRIKHDTFYEDQYSILKQHCTRKMKINVEEYSNKKDEAKLDENTIIINIRTKPEHRLYSLLHEIGHFILYRGKYYELLYVDTLLKQKEQLIMHIEEESAAWVKGLMLANRLKLQIDINKYNKYRIKNIKTYITHYIIGD